MQPAMGFHVYGAEVQHSDSAGRNLAASESPHGGVLPSENDHQVANQSSYQAILSTTSGNVIDQVNKSKRSTRKSNRSFTHKRAAPAKNASLSISPESNLLKETSDAYGAGNFSEDCCNELISKLISTKLKSNGLAHCSAFKLILPMAASLSLTKHGCRVIQKAIEVGDSKDHTLLVEQLAGNITELYKSPNGNHVAQQIIISMPPIKLDFLLAELKGSMTLVAKHQFGCRLPERLLEHCPPEQIESLIDELLVNAKPFCCHPYGNFAMQHIFEYGSGAMKAQIVEQVVDDLPHLSKHRIASHVVQKALGFCGEDLQQILLSALMRGEGDESIVALGCTRYGSYVIASLANNQVYHKDVCERLQDSLSQLAQDQYGVRVIARFGLSTTVQP